MGFIVDKYPSYWKGFFPFDYYYPFVIHNPSHISVGMSLNGKLELHHCGFDPNNPKYNNWTNHIGNLSMRLDLPKYNDTNTNLTLSTFIESKSHLFTTQLCYIDGSNKLTYLDIEAGVDNGWVSLGMLGKYS